MFNSVANFFLSKRTHFVATVVLTFFKLKQLVLVDCPSSRLNLFQGLSLLFFRVCFVVVLASFFEPPEPKTPPPLGHPGAPPRPASLSLSIHIVGLGTFVPTSEIALLLGLAEVEEELDEEELCSSPFLLAFPLHRDIPLHRATC